MGMFHLKQSAFRKFFVAALAGCASGFVIGQVNYCFGVLVPEWSDEFTHWSRTEINSAFSISQAATSLGGTPIGYLMDKYGARVTVALSLVSVALGFCIISLAPKATPDVQQGLWQLWLSYVVIGLGFTGTSVLGAGKIVGSWFDSNRRGRVMGVVTACNNLFGLVMVQCSTAVIGVSGWRNATAMFSGMCAALALIYFFVVRNEPLVVETDVNKVENQSQLEGENLETDSNNNSIDIEEPSTISHDKDSSDKTCIEEVVLDSSSPVVLEKKGDIKRAPEPSTALIVGDDQIGYDSTKTKEDNESISPVDSSSSMDGKSSIEQEITFKGLLHDRLFYSSTVGMLCAYWTYSGILSQLIPALIAEGFTNAEAANIVSFVAIGGIVSKLSCGMLSEKFGAIVVLMGLMLGQITALIIFCVVSTDGSTWYAVSAICYGLSFGGVGAMVPLVSLEIFGNQSFGKVFGIQSTFFIIPSLLAPIIAGLSYDQTESYKKSFLATAGVFFVGMCCLFISLRQKKHRLESEI